MVNRHIKPWLKKKKNNINYCLSFFSISTEWLQLAMANNEIHQFKRLWNICHGLLISKFHHTVNNIYFILWFFGLAIPGALLFWFLNYIGNEFDESTLDPFNLSLYSNAIVLTDIVKSSEVEMVGQSINDIAAAYERVAMLAGATIRSFPTGIESFLMTRDVFDKLKTYVAAATFQERYITAWFNRELYHGSPISLSLVYKAIGIAGSSIDIDVINKPRADANELVMTGFSSGKPAVLITLYLSIIMPFFGWYIIQEKWSQIRHPLFMSNCDIFNYWLLNLVWDFVLYLYIVMSIMIAVFWQTEQIIIWIMVLLLTFGFSAIAFIYLLSVAVPHLTFIISINVCIGN